MDPAWRQGSTRHGQKLPLPHSLTLFNLTKIPENSKLLFIFFGLLFTHCSPQFCNIQLVVTVLSHRCNSRTDLGEAKVESRAPSKTRPHQAALLLDTLHSQPGSQPHQCVGGNTVQLATEVSMHAPIHHKEWLERNGTRTSQPVKPSPNPDDAGPIVHRFMGLPVAASCNTARDQTWICSDASSTVTQFLRPLRHSGGP